jgi:molecular chaperone GrpE
MIDDVREELAGEGAEATPPADEQREANAGELSDEPAGTGATGTAPPPGAVEAADYKDRWLRSEAEMQNVRRRAARDRDEAIAGTEARFLLDLVELLDDLERALAVLTEEQQREAWAQGVSLTAQRMRDTLARWNVTAVETVGRPFDPTVHEALLEIDAPAEIAPGHVAQEALKGYRRGERTLRAARVVVAKSPADR